MHTVYTVLYTVYTVLYTVYTVRIYSVKPTESEFTEPTESGFTELEDHFENKVLLWIMWCTKNIINLT